MTYYIITLIFLFLFGILVFKLWEYSRKNLLLNSEILKNLEKLNTGNGIEKTESPKLLTIISCLDEIASNTRALNKKGKNLE